MEIILSGNPNLDTIKNVLYFANKYHDGRIEEVFFIDNQESLHDSYGDSLESERNVIVRSILGENVVLGSRKYKKEDLHKEIPKLISEHLHSHYNKSESIIIDLTNGTKYISSLLYASAIFSRIKNLFYLNIPYNKQKIPPEELKESDYFIDVFKSVENIESLAKHIYFEIIYYMDRITKIIDNFNQYKFEKSYLNNRFESEINLAVSNYFMGDYKTVIATLGQIFEDLSIEICGRIKSLAQGKLILKIPKNLDGAITWLRENFNNPFRGKTNEMDFLIYEEKLKELRHIDLIIEIIRVYRNQSAHPYSFLREREDANLILNNSLYILEKLIQSGIFK